MSRLRFIIKTISLQFPTIKLRKVCLNLDVSSSSSIIQKASCKLEAAADLISISSSSQNLKYNS